MWAKLFITAIQVGVQVAGSGKTWKQVAKAAALGLAGAAGWFSARVPQAAAETFQHLSGLM